MPSSDFFALALGDYTLTFTFAEIQLLTRRSGILFLLPATHFHSITALLWAQAATLHESVSQSWDSEQVVSVMHHSSLDRNSHYLQGEVPAALLLAQ